MKRHYFLRVGTSLSQLINTVLLNGDPDESISGRAYRRGVLEGSKKWGRISDIIDLIFFWEPLHSYSSHQHDIDRAKMLLGIK